ncbi:MAG TPA: hypothetical protein VNM87_12940 [Candidatus Udaeobacter sp.]|nr:hypothetical protein [Candidatus Udaeobacter sp.]
MLGLAFALAYIAFRNSPPMLAGYEADVDAYLRWFNTIAASGLRNVYARSPFDYPPLYAYFLWVVAKGVAFLGRLGVPTPSGPMLVRFWPIGFDLAIGGMLAWIGRAASRSAAATAAPGKRPAPRWGWILPALYLLNPAVLFDTGYWGQTDSIHSAFVLAAFLALGATRTGLLSAGAGDRLERGWPTWVAWVLLSLGGLMKPIALPYFPLLLVLSIVWRGIRPTLVGMGAALITVVLFCLPFMRGGPWAFIEEIVKDFGSMPFTSCNAHNLWWILGPWRPANEPWLFGVSATDVGYVLFGICLLAILVKTWTIAWRRSPSLAEALGLAAVLGVGFFLLSTHMHENHLFTPIPLLLPLVVLPWANGPARTRTALWILAGVSIGTFINMMAHDPRIMSHWPWLEGPEMFENPALVPGVPRRVLAGCGTAINFGAAVGLFRLVFQRQRLGPE